MNGKNPKSVTTIECGRINCTVPYIKTYTPDEFAQNVLDGMQREIMVQKE